MLILNYTQLRVDLSPKMLIKYSENCVCDMTTETTIIQADNYVSTCGESVFSLVK